jgi:hypothetical protein
MTGNDGKGVTIDIMGRLVKLIRQGNVIPVISNAFRIEQIFRDDEELSAMMAEVPQFYDEFRTFDHQLTNKWATSINYPMSDYHNLARVAQYLQVESADAFDSWDWQDPREKYMQFLVDRLLSLSEKDSQYENDEDYKYAVSAFRKASKDRPQLFSEVATQLGYPRFMEGDEDPLRLLAKLPVSIYITTSYSNFLERALEKEDKTPRTQVCFCKLKSIKKTEHWPDRNFQPTEKSPAVVHLFGLEDYINTLVLSEDDHINFLLNAVESLGKENVSEMYPAYLQGALSESSLLLLGYHMRDWDFRTLFRFISKVRKPDSMEAKVAPSIAIQFRPSLGRKENETRSLKYLEEYFKTGKFMVKWNTIQQFIYELWKTYNA